VCILKDYIQGWIDQLEKKERRRVD